MLKTPQHILQETWGYPRFRGSQEKIIDAALRDKDVLALLPTGGGKSLCFQVPALARDGICIVVSPLVALMKNQVDRLREKGIKALAITGGLRFGELDKLLDNCLYGDYKFLYLSPERLQQPLVKERISRMDVNLIAIDEAHCISQWGHDFRPAYLQCSQLRELFPEIPILALTATATERVIHDIMEHLRFNEPLVIKDSFARKNIAFKVTWQEDKRHELRRLCSKSKGSAIVYVRSRRLTEELAQYLGSHGLGATFFHGGLSKGEKDKRLIQWLGDAVPIMVATNAFGMGIDKPDVGLVVHFQIPDCLENYFQETGRAGRDGNPAEAVLITNALDQQQVKDQFLGVLPDLTFLKKAYHKLNNYFQIAYGEGNDQTFQLNFNEFCGTYGLPTLLTYNALRLLDLNSVIALSESFARKSTVRFLADKQQIFGYLENNQELGAFLQTLLRTYGGIFDFDTKINTYLLAKKLGTHEGRVLDFLKTLEKEGLISYQAGHSDMDITFLVPREDEKSINVLGKAVKKQNRIKRENLRHMLAYINTDTICRSKQLLTYFGEPVAADCGRCDVCLAKVKMPTTTQLSRSKTILRLLEEQSRTSRQLIQLLDWDQHQVLNSLKELLEDGSIQINAKNEYELM